MNIKEKEKDIYDVDAWMDAEYGAVGTPEREQFRREACAFCAGQIICDARKKEKMTQSELAARAGTTKSYISRIERGTVEPGMSLFFRIISALGMRVDIVKPVM